MIQIITSESVGIGHPDKICDNVSDRILQLYLTNDKNAKVACECFAVNKTFIIGGEISSVVKVDHKRVAKNFLKKLGYDVKKFKFIDKVNKQSPDITQAVFKSNGDIAAGDQGIVYGYATDESHNYMPVGFNLSNDILKLLSKRYSGLGIIKFDMKSQVSFEYKNGIPFRINTILVSAQHEKNKYDEANLLIREVIDEFKNNEYCGFFDENTKILINPSGKFEIGGPIGDTGLTGRKIIVDTYGGVGRHGGGAFSGKDPSKVDRTGAYYARFLAQNIVKMNLAKKAEVQISFAIGINKPISFFIETFGTSKLKSDQILKILEKEKLLNWTVKEMINNLIYSKELKLHHLSTYGHFGRDDLNVAWEKDWKQLKKELSLKKENKNAS